MKRILALLSTGFVTLTMVACSGGFTPSGSMKMALTMDLDGGKDVARIRYQLDRVGCNSDEIFEPLKVVRVKDLEDMRMPGMIPGFENKPLDKKSSHLFADNFETLPAGCYNVSISPLNLEGQASKDCAGATRKNVAVKDGQTTEFSLLVQCQGNKHGNLDVVAALNHSPDIVKISYKPSKFVFECETTTVCATAMDPDKDPVEFVWSHKKGPKAFASFKVVSTKTVGNKTTQCVSYVARYTASYTLSVQVFDQMRNGSKLIRIEDYLKDRGQNDKSSDTMDFPLHVNWDIEHQCIDKNGKLKHYASVRVVKRAASCTWTTPAQYYCNPKYVDTSVHCPNKKFAPKTVYRACE